MIGIIPPAAKYTGHLPNSGIQAHSAGPLFPAVLYVMGFENTLGMYHGVTFEGFDYGLFFTYEEAEKFAHLIKNVRFQQVTGTRDEACEAEREAGLYLDNRVFRPGLVPAESRSVDSTARHLITAVGGIIAQGVGTWVDAPLYSSSGALEANASRPHPMERPDMPVDGLSAPAIIRARYGYTEAADVILRQFGFNPSDFLFQPVLAPIDDGQRAWKAPDVPSRHVSWPAAGIDATDLAGFFQEEAGAGKDAIVCTMDFTQREVDTLIASLRYWQREGLMSTGHEQDIACENGDALNAEEIDELVEELNS